MSKNGLLKFYNIYKSLFVSENFIIYNLMLLDDKGEIFIYIMRIQIFEISSLYCNNFPIYLFKFVYEVLPHLIYILEYIFSLLASLIVPIYKFMGYINEMALILRNKILN